MLSVIKDMKFSSKLNSESWVDLLNYKFMTYYLLCCSFIITSKQYVSDPVLCINDSRYQNDFVNVYCWSHGTQLIKYYQFVGLYLLLQSCLFYFPHLILKHFSYLNTSYLIVGIIYLRIFNIAVQFYATSLFLQTNFLTSVNNLKSIFPLKSTCKVAAYGASGGTIDNYHVCLLPLNAFNDKIFFGYWILLNVLLFVNLGNLLFFTSVSYSKRFRKFTRYDQFFVNKAEHV